MMALYTILVSAILAVVWPLALGLYVVRKRYLLHRLMPPPGIVRGDGPRVWLHAASVGESGVAYSAALEVKRRRPEADVYVSTATTTGLANIRRLNAGSPVPAVTASFLAPFDHPMVVRRFIRAVRPTLMLVVETELWPWLLTALDRAQTPVVVINGRLSAKAVRRYRLIRRSIERIAQRLTLVCVQTRVYAKRYRAIGVPEDRILVLGNVKFDGLPEPGDIRRANARRELGLPQDVRVFTAGSTRPGEEEIIAASFVRLRRTVPNAILVIAPRHLNRADEVAAILTKSGITVARRSRAEQPVDTGAAALLLDTMGELLFAFAASDVAFVGGSLADFGGHNPLEPAALGVPVLFGPYMKQAGWQELVTGGAALVVKHADELSGALRELTPGGERHTAMADAGPRVVASFKGTLARTLDELDARDLL